VVRRRLGLQGPAITPVGLGTWAFGGPWEFGWGPADDELSVSTIRHAVGHGVNWIDTAPLYGLGHAEEILATALAPFRVGEDVLVLTKCGRRWTRDADATRLDYDLRPESMREQCDESLRRLRIERIDLYQFHWPDYATDTPVEESWGVMDELVQEGKVRWAGVCNFAPELLERCEAVRHVDSLQQPLSMLSRHARDVLIPWCREHGTGVIAYSPLASGLLTGRFSVDRLAPDDWRRRAAPFQEPKLTQARALVQRLGPVADRYGVGLAALAVAWVLAAPGVTGAIVGARRPEQVDAWLSAADLELAAADLEEIETAIAETGAGTQEPPSPPGVGPERLASVLGAARSG
jgi:aryl-alcohol dehydrogenase-like predicted oxidoreductase